MARPTAYHIPDTRTITHRTPSKTLTWAILSAPAKRADRQWANQPTVAQVKWRITTSLARRTRPVPCWTLLFGHLLHGDNRLQRLFGARTLLHRSPTAPHKLDTLFGVRPAAVRSGSCEAHATTIIVGRPSKDGDCPGMRRCSSKFWRRYV